MDLDYGEDMSRVSSFDFRHGLIAIVSLVALGGCGGADAAGSSSSSAPKTAAANSGTISRPAPTISGVAPSTATVGRLYSFQPKATSGSGGALTFTFANKPSWASFDSKTGKLSGTPGAGDVRVYQNIQMAVTDGTSWATLFPFSITVAPASASTPASSSTVSLSWTPPTQNSDGTQLLNLKGYHVHYGTKSQSYANVINVANAGLTNYVVQNLPTGKYYFAVSAYTATGAESSLSTEVSASVAN